MRGLENLGNTCYFNSAIQCLAHVPALSKYLFLNSYDGPCEITREYQRVAKQLFLKDGKDPVNPSNLLSEFRKKFPHFANSSQHDAQEVIVHLIDVFEQSLGKKLIQDIFNGEEIQETTYPDGSSSTTTTFTTLILDVNSNSKLESILEDRMKHSIISDYVDSAGKKHHVAAIQRKVHKWPKVIMFTFAMYQKKFKIEIPLTFEGKSLFAVVLHMGIQWGGHYAMAVKRYDKWFIKDDESVREIDEPPTSGSFYMACYR
jgi:ubiquitin C-terminal hydrolase